MSSGSFPIERFGSAEVSRLTLRGLTLRRRDGLLMVPPVSPHEDEGNADNSQRAKR